MPYQLTNKKDKALSIAPALDMLEKFVMQKKREEDIKTVTSIVSGNFNSVKSVDELLGKQSEVIHNIISNPDIDPEVKSYGMQLINTYTNVLSNKLKQEEIKKEKSLTLEGLKDNYFLLNDKVYKGEELIADYKSKGLTEDQIYDAVSKIKRLAVNYELKQLSQEEIKKLGDNRIKYKVSKVLKDESGREIQEVPDDENIYIKINPKDFSSSAVKLENNKFVEVDYDAEKLFKASQMEYYKKQMSETKSQERGQKLGISTVVPKVDMKAGGEVIPAGTPLNVYYEATPQGYKYYVQRAEGDKLKLIELKNINGNIAITDDFVSSKLTKKPEELAIDKSKVYTEEILSELKTEIGNLEFKNEKAKELAMSIIENEGSTWDNIKPMLLTLKNNVTILDNNSRRKLGRIIEETEKKMHKLYNIEDETDINFVSPQNYQDPNKKVQEGLKNLGINF